MGFYLRKSLRAGPFRVNLSKSGIGVSTGVPGFRVGMGPRGNYVRVGAQGVYYRATLGPRRSRGLDRATSTLPISSDTNMLMTDLTGADAQTLEATGPGDLVDQLNRAARRPLLWPWAAALVSIVVGSVSTSPVAAVAVLIVGTMAVIWLGLWERPRRTVIAFYEVSGPGGEWFASFTDGYHVLRTMAAAWRIQSSGAVTGTYQYKVNSGASSIVRRRRVSFSLKAPRQLTTNIAVPSIICDRNRLLFLPDRVLVASRRTWSDVSYAALSVRATPQRFIEDGPVPRDGKVVDRTWKYVNVKGGPDRRFKNNQQLPVMLYGRISLSSPTGLQWLVDCSRLDAAQWAVQLLTTAPC